MATVGIIGGLGPESTVDYRGEPTTVIYQVTFGSDYRL